MSDAKKCDRCDELYEVTKGVLELEIHVVTAGGAGEKEDRVWDTWSNVDFCPRCSKIVLEAIGDAIEP